MNVYYSFFIVDMEMECTKTATLVPSQKYFDMYFGKDIKMTCK